MLRLSGCNIWRELIFRYSFLPDSSIPGKPTFIQGSLEDERFNNGVPTLLVVCEEGEEEYDFSAFANDCVTRMDVESVDRLTPDRLEPHARDAVPSVLSLSTTGCGRSTIFFRAFPNNWAAVQEITFADSQTYPSYNANMRSLVVDKLKTWRRRNV